VQATKTFLVVGRAFRVAGKSEIRNPKSEIANLFPAMMFVSVAGVAEWQTLGT